MVETKLLWMKNSYFDDTIDGELHAVIDMDSYKYNMERKLKESEKWQAAIINNIGDAVIAIDEKGFIKLINPFAEALTGWSKVDAVGKPLKEIFNIINEKTGEIAEYPVIKVMREGTFFGLSEQLLSFMILLSGIRWNVQFFANVLVAEKVIKLNENKKK